MQYSGGISWEWVLTTRELLPEIPGARIHSVQQLARRKAKCQMKYVNELLSFISLIGYIS